MIVRVSVFALTALLAAGCNSGAKIVPVSGTVTLDGKPLVNAHVAFQPIASGVRKGGSVGSYAVTEEGGRFTLRSFTDDQPGAAVGKHRVEIDLKVESDDAPRGNKPPPKHLPARYNRDTELEYEVPPGGATAANF